MDADSRKEHESDANVWLSYLPQMMMYNSIEKSSSPLCWTLTLSHFFQLSIFAIEIFLKAVNLWIKSLIFFF